MLLPGSKPREAAFGLNERAQAAADAGKLGTISDVILECLHNDPQMRPTAQSIVPVRSAHCLERMKFSESTAAAEPLYSTVVAVLEAPCERTAGQFVHSAVSGFSQGHRFLRAEGSCAESPHRLCGTRGSNFSLVQVLEAETERARIDLKLLQDELAQLSQHVDGYTQARVYPARCVQDQPAAPGCPPKLERAPLSGTLIKQAARQ